MENLGIKMSDATTSTHVLEDKMQVYLQHIRLATVALLVLIAALLITLGTITVKVVLFL